MLNKGQILLFILLLLISLSGGYWFYNNFQWQEEIKDVGFQGEAKTNNLLAAEFFLRKMGIPVQQVNGLTALRDLPPASHTILIATSRETLNKQLSEKLLAWVRSGGHLIVRARYLADDEDYKDDLLDAWQIYLSTQKTDEDTIAKYSLAQEPLTVTVDDTQLEVLLPTKLTLKTALDKVNVGWQIHDNNAYHLLQLPLEQGMITVLSSSAMFNNQHIADYDNARFLHYLLQQQANNSGVWLIRTDDMPPLWQWLWHNAQALVLPLLVLLFFWLWRAPLRFGPLLNDAAPQRRSLLEHISASGYYRWHHEQSGYLLAQVQDRLWEAVHRQHPAIRRERQAESYTQLAAITGVKEALIVDALQTIETINKAGYKNRHKQMHEQAFTQKIKILEQIRRNL